MGLSVDSEESVRLVNQAHLTRWGITFDEALGRAIGNLGERSADAWLEIIPGLFRSPWGDSHDPSRLLIPGLVERFRMTGPVVAVPVHRECVFLADLAVPAAVSRLVQLVRSEVDHPRFIGATPIIWDGSSWVQYVGVPHQPACEALETLSMEGRGQAYADQRAYLERLHEHTGADVFVASFGSLIPKGTTRPRSYATWTKGVDTLLPRTDLVAVGDPDRGEGKFLLGLFRFEDLEKVAGSFLKQVGMTPERWLTTGFPTDEMLSTIESLG